jgi:hypothetical protein
MDEIVIVSDSSNLFKLAKGMELLKAAKIRQTGYIKFAGMDKTALWYSSRDQKRNERDIVIIACVISRLENYCREKCETILINI